MGIFCYYDSLHSALIVNCMFMWLQSEVASVVESQHSLERQLELIETHQQEVPKVTNI
jgi:hypothetical protein